MESPSYELTLTGYETQFRPIRVCLVLARQKHVVSSPGDVMALLRSILTAIQQQGTLVSADSVWMSPTGNIELVWPLKRGCSFAASISSLGMLACEALACDSLPENLAPGLALNYAKARVEARSPELWDVVTEHYLKRMLGLSMRFNCIFNCIQEALRELDYLFPQTTRNFEVRQFEPVVVATTLVHGAAIRPTPIKSSADPAHAKPYSWWKPCLAGAASTLLVGGAILGAFRLGEKRTPAPQVVYQTGPTNQTLTFDAGALAKLVQLLSPPAPAPVASAVVKTRPAVTVRRVETEADPVAERKKSPNVVHEEDGPMFVDGPAPGFGSADVGRVTSHDFVALVK